MTTVQEVQKELLEKLYEIREEFNQQLKNVQSQDNNAEVVELKDKVRRLEYRVEHLQQGFDLLQEQEVKKKFYQQFFIKQRKLLSENALLKEQLANK